MNGINKKCIKTVVSVILIIYLAVLLYFLFFSIEYRNTWECGYRYNIIPFSEIRRFIKNYRIIGAKGFATNILGNVAAFIPFGIFLPFLCNGYKKNAIVILDGFIFSLCIEAIQLITRVGSFDVDDIILNTLGVAIGYFLYRLIRHYICKNNRTDVEH